MSEATLLQQLVPEPQVDRELVRRFGFAEFCRLAWPEIDSDDLVWSWHLDQIARHLEAVSRGELRRLIINVPPGMSKSSMVSALWPAWDWLVCPSRKWMFATFDPDLAFRDALRCRGLVKSPWYQERWSDRVQIAPAGAADRETMSIYSTTAGGRRLSVTVAGKGTGWHADIQVVDDPTKPKDVASAPDVAREALERTWKWWTGTMASRKTDPKRFARVIIMQRLHEEDLCGRILNSANAPEWTHLCLPMEYEPERPCKTAYGGDIRTRPGELLCPERFDAAAVAETKAEMGSQVAASQLQQRPAPAAGNIFQRAWFAARWRELPAELVLVQSWDCTFKDSASSDYVAGHIWGYSAGKYYLVDRIHDRMGLPDTCAAILSWCRKWPKAYGKLIEDKANGPAVEQVLRDKVVGMIMVEPKDIGGSKIARANAIAPMVEAGNIVLPDAAVHPWADEVLEELVTFPFARHDDDVDAATQAILHLHGRSNARYIEAMARIRSGDIPSFFKRRSA